MDLWFILWKSCWKLQKKMLYKDEIYSVKQITYILQDLSDSTKDYLIQNWKYWVAPNAWVFP